MRIERYQLSVLLTTTLQNFSKLLCCFPPQFQVITETKVEFPHFLGKSQKYLQTGNRKHKNISQENTNCLEISSLCLELLQGCSEYQPAALCNQQHALALRQVCVTLRNCLEGTDLNKILGNILETCHDLEYHLKSPQHHCSQIFRAENSFFFPGKSHV